MNRVHFIRVAHYLSTTLFLLTVAAPLAAANLGIREAEQLAQANDPALMSIEARSRSMSELAEASSSLPDPQLKLGFANLPVDSFSLDQEPMTQTVIGLRQVFPRGKTRTLSQQRVRDSIAGNDAEAEDRTQQVLLATRAAFVGVYLQTEHRRILEQSRITLTDLAEITREYYGSGRAHQQDVIQARLELAKVEERLARVHQQEDQARADLAQFIGNDAYRDIDPGWPILRDPNSVQEIMAKLAEHPKLRAWRHRVESSRTAEDITRQAYKPGFAVDLAYGGRSGRNMDGSSRSDFLSVFVSMDLPLFTGNRQDRKLASNIAETTAMEFARDDVLRTMQASVQKHDAALAGNSERLRMYEELLLPQAEFNAEAAFEAYQDAVGSLTTLLRARIGEYELKLSHADLRAGEIRTRAQLLYLQGKTS